MKRGNKSGEAMKNNFKNPYTNNNTRHLSLFCITKHHSRLVGGGSK